MSTHHSDSASAGQQTSAKPESSTQFALNRLNRYVIREIGTTIRLVLPDGTPVANAEFTLTKTNGDIVTETLDEQGAYTVVDPSLLDAILVFSSGPTQLEADYHASQDADNSTAPNQGTEAP